MPGDAFNDTQITPITAIAPDFLPLYFRIADSLQKGNPLKREWHEHGCPG
jgi:hypothetical protein